jgi:DNA-directed RNA polymerase specialized sigma24 family protein
MDKEEQRFRTLLENGNPAAWQELLDRYRIALLQIIQSQLNDSIRNESSTEDILDSALASFARRALGGELDLRNWKMVWGTLRSFVIHKCFEAVRRSDRSPTVQSPQAECDDGEIVNWESIGSQPPPEVETDWNDLAETLVVGLPDYAPRALRLLLGGHNITKIAKELELPRYSVQRVIEKMAQRLERILRE